MDIDQDVLEGAFTARVVVSSRKSKADETL
jgi:predicted amino acid-binding ACT domain protein